MNKHFFFHCAQLIVFSLFLRLLCGCECSRSETDALTQAVESSFKYLKEENYDGYLSYFDVSDRKKGKMKKEIRKEINQREGIKKFKLSEKTINDNNTQAEVKIKIEYEDGSTEYIDTNWEKIEKNGSAHWRRKVENGFFGGIW